MAFNARKIIAATLILLSATARASSGRAALDDKQKQEIGDFIKEYLSPIRKSCWKRSRR